MDDAEYLDYDDIIDDAEEVVERTPPSSSKRKRTRKPPPKVDHSWTDDQIIKLIEEVEAQVCIWNAKSADYKNINMRDIAWQAIATSFEGTIPVKQLSTKWRNLRRQYRASNTNRSKTKSGQGAANPPQWKFHPNMSFVGNAEEEQTVVSETNFSSILDAVSNCFGIIKPLVHGNNSRSVCISISDERFSRRCVLGFYHFQYICYPKWIKWSGSTQTKIDRHRVG